LPLPPLMLLLLMMLLPKAASVPAESTMRTVMVMIVADFVLPCPT
jgi:hypothetical protein